MIGRYTGGIVPTSTEDTPLDHEAEARIRGYRDVMDRHLVHEGAREMWGLVSRANQFVEETAPWNLAKAKETGRLEQTLGALARGLARITLLIQPFIPAKAELVWKVLGLGGTRWEALERPQTAGASVGKLAPLFPKLEHDVVSI